MLQRSTHRSPRALAVSALAHMRLCCTVSKAKLLQGASSRTEGLCLCLFVLPAAPNPCHRVSTWVSTCPHSPVEVPWLDSQHISPWGSVGHGQFRGSDSGVTQGRDLLGEDSSVLLSRGCQGFLSKTTVCRLDLGCQRGGLAA